MQTLVAVTGLLAWGWVAFVSLSLGTRNDEHPTVAWCLLIVSVVAMALFVVAGSRAHGRSGDSAAKNLSVRAFLLSMVLLVAFWTYGVPFIDGD